MDKGSKRALIIGIGIGIFYYQKRGYGIIPDEFMPGNTVSVNHKIKMVHFNCQ